eukprot:500833-Amphidinium_carterae.1
MFSNHYISLYANTCRNCYEEDDEPDIDDDDKVPRHPLFEDNRAHGVIEYQANSPHAALDVPTNPSLMKSELLVLLLC